MSLFVKRALSPSPDPIRVSTWLPGVDWSGESVTEANALEVSSVLACVSLIADSAASLPLDAVRHIGDRTEPVAKPTWLSSSTVTEYELVHMLVTSLAFHGNAYLFVDRSSSTSAPLAITPLHPTSVQVTIQNRQRHYLVSGVSVDPENMLHLRWWTPPQSAVGLSPVQMSKTTIGLALAMERHLAQFYSEGATPSSVLEVDGDMTETQAKTLAATWETSNRRRRRPAVLTGGMKWRPITTSAADNEMNETRAEQIAQVARIFRVPAYMIGARGDSQTYQNNESAGMHFVTYTLLPWLRRIESALSTLMPQPRELVFNTAGFLRADTITRYQSYSIAIQNRILTPNEARSIEGLEPYAGGDDFLMTSAPIPVGTDPQPPL